MKFVTICTHANGYFPILLESCKRHGIELVTLGWNQKWQGFIWRQTLQKSYLLELMDQGLQDEIICFVDAYDVICLQNPEIIEQRFLKFEKDIVISSEFQTGLVSDYFYKRLFGPPCAGHKLNAGMYIGRCFRLVQFLNELTSWSNDGQEKDDQRLMMRCCHGTYNKSSKFSINPHTSILHKVSKALVSSLSDSTVTDKRTKINKTSTQSSIRNNVLVEEASNNTNNNSNSDNRNVSPTRMTEKSNTIDHFVFLKHVAIDSQGILFLNIQPDTQHDKLYSIVEEQNLSWNTTSSSNSDNSDNSDNRNNNTIRREKIIVNRSGLEPCFIHGPANTDLSFFVKLYNYGGFVYPFRRDYSWHVLRNNWKIFVYEIICFFILLLVFFFLIFAFYRTRTKKKSKCFHNKTN